MNNFKICICEDQKARLALINAKITSLRRKYKFLDIPIVLTFKEILEDNKLFEINPDILILDLFDEVSKKWLGIDCLDLMKSSASNIQTILFSGDKQGAEKNKNFKSEYGFVITEIDKNKDRIDGLSNELEKILLRRLPKQYILSDENDLILLFQISTIGENNLNQLIKQIVDKFEITTPIFLERMVSGYSGAFLFKINYNNISYILKISSEIEKLEQEFENSKKYYHKFPNRFFNYINPESFNTSDGKTIAILIKLIDQGKTLFDFILVKKDSEEIKLLLTDIYLNEFGLKSHYAQVRDKHKSWTSLFDKFNENRFTIIDNVIKELGPLISETKFNHADLKNLIIYQSFKNLDKTKLHKTSELVLCHGDLHSKNILIQGSHPFLIDTGGINYNYWCFDICRLIVDLFIKGIDHSKRAFYDINNIHMNVEMAKNIIDQKQINLDGNNDNFINAINWLISNCSEIYGVLFCKFEFQLGLMKEFLQISYRIDTIPPNKRAIALLAAYECMLSANETV